jgi:hypothetical protein
MFKSIYLNGYSDAYTAEEVAANLEAVLNRGQLFSVIVARIGGFSPVEAGPLLNGVDGHPDQLARVIELFEQTEGAAKLYEEAANAIGPKAIRSAHRRQKDANAAAAKDALLSVHTKIVELAANPVSEYRMARIEARFKDLQKTKGPRGNVPTEAKRNPDFLNTCLIPH